MRRRTTVLLVIAAAVVLVAGGLVTGLSLLGGSPAAGPECTVPGDGDAAQPTVTLDAVQLQHASTINAVGLARGIPERGRIIALATAWQESSLRNLDHGDRDSVGLFQQRTSQGWGSVSEIMDPVYASGKFYDALLNVAGWQRMPLTEAAQAVQYSGFPGAYAKWEPQATTLALALGGTRPLALSCRAGATASTADAPVRPAVPGAEGARPGLADLLGAAQAELGGLGVNSVSADGRSATVTVAVPETGGEAAGRALAAWAVSHATTMAVAAVTVSDRIWVDHTWSATGQPALAAGTVVIQVSN